MDYEYLRRNLRGTFIFAITPFKVVEGPEGKTTVVDEEGVRKNIRFFAYQKGQRVIVVCAGTGEFHDLTPEENRLVVENAAREKGDAILISGVGGDTPQAVEMTRTAQEAGSDVVLVMPHEEVIQRGEEEIYRHHRAIAEAVEIGVMPFRNKMSLLPLDLVLRLMEIPNVVALKDESGDIGWCREMYLTGGGRIPQITGGEMMAPFFFLAGAKGITTGVANLVPRVSMELCDAALAKDYERAMEVRDRLVPITELRGRAGNTMLKGGLEMMGLAGGPIRSTMAVISEEHKRELREILVGFGVLS